MFINYTILGLLEQNNMSGYDLKKAIQYLPFFPWSGNNNQIYKVLVELLEEELVTNEIMHQDSSPSKKIYSITEKGRTKLHEWVIATDPEIPEFKKMFLVQLACSENVSFDKIKELLNQYENSIQTQIVLHKEQKRRKQYFPDQTKKNTYVWEMLYENIIYSYLAELDWIKKFKVGLEDLE